ncbi:hypothetical protein Dimus_036859 [Dionaea muscipula]
MLFLIPRINFRGHGKVVDGREIMVQFAKYGLNAERIYKGRIAELVLETRPKSRSPRRRHACSVILIDDDASARIWSPARSSSSSCFLHATYVAAVACNVNSIFSPAVQEVRPTLKPMAAHQDSVHCSSMATHEAQLAANYHAAYGQQHSILSNSTLRPY